MLGYKDVRGFVWPGDDVECQAVVFDRLADLAQALTYCKDFREAVQAGGNTGVWPRFLAEKFRAVYTFEPDDKNFYCLAQNCQGLNVFKFQAALGRDRKKVGLARQPGNAGAHYINGYGIIPMVCVDDLSLDHCDFIQLDVEGYEMEALKGAEYTIKHCLPVVMVEDKGLSEKYGTPQGRVEGWLKNYGYEVMARPNRDIILKAR